jgi:cell wall-associated NlpC family hydrolase
MKFGTLIAEGMRQGAHPQPGDLALFKVVRSKVYNHGAIVTEWPMGVHAGCDGVREINLATHPLTSFRVMAVLDPFNNGGGTLHFGAELCSPQSQNASSQAKSGL